MGHKPDRGRSMRQGRAGLGWPAHVGGWATHSRAHFGPTLVSVVYGPLLSEFRDFRDRILSCCHDVLPPHLFPIYLYAQHVETNTYSKSREQIIATKFNLYHIRHFITILKLSKL